MVDRDSPLPAYFQISRDLRRRISTGEWKPGSRLPAESSLAQQYQVSRMTMRQAIMALVKDGILARKRGSGTFVNLSFIEFLDEVKDMPGGMGVESEGMRLRNKVWSQLRDVAQPDSRFGWDFSLFIPDFEGNERGTTALRESDLYRLSQSIFIAPDNSLTLLRQFAIEDQKTVLVAYPGIARGFRLLTPGCVPTGQEALAATLDGMERFSRQASLADIRAEGRIDLMVTGVAFVTLQGVRWGLGYEYFDLDWAIFRELGVVQEETPVVVFGHDCQVVDMQLEVSPSDTLADWIVTPSRMLYTSRDKRRPKGVFWKYFSSDQVERISSLRELVALQVEQVSAA